MLKVFHGGKAEPLSLPLKCFAKVAALSVHIKHADWVRRDRIIFLQVWAEMTTRGQMRFTHASTSVMEEQSSEVLLKKINLPVDYVLTNWSIVLPIQWQETVNNHPRAKGDVLVHRFKAQREHQRVFTFTWKQIKFCCFFFNNWQIIIIC